eukprot:10779555-Alexandrium_andersonii.AAC.1
MLLVVAAGAVGHRGATTQSMLVKVPFLDRDRQRSQIVGGCGPGPYGVVLGREAFASPDRL